MNIHKSGLYQIACRYTMFPCADIWIATHIDLEKMVLSSVIETQISTFRVKDFQEMYHLPQLVITMDTPFTRPSNNANSRDILKRWMKKPSKFTKTPSQVYKMRILWKACQLLVIFACRLYGQESAITFPGSWVILLDQLASEGRPCNWSDMWALRLKE